MKIIMIEIDDNIKCQNPNVQYRNKLDVIYQFSDNQDICYGEGFIKGIKKVNDSNIIIHKITNNEGSSGIILLFYLII